MTEQSAAAQHEHDEYAWYEDAIAGKNPVIHDGKPQLGWFKTRRNKNDLWLPTIIYREQETGKIVAFRGFSSDAPKVLPEHLYQAVDVKQIWPWAGENWVRWEDFDTAYRTGEWPGSAPALGHNKEPEGYAALKEAILEQVSEANGWLKKSGPLTTKEQGDKARDWQARIDKLRLAADKAFRVEKDPINKLADECDERWSFRKKAVSAAGALKKAWEAVARRLEEEQQAKIKAELEAGKPVEELKPVEKVVMGGTSTGGGRSLRSVQVCVIKDIDKVIEYLKTTPAMREWLDEHVKRLHRAGVEVPGTAVETQKVA